MVSVLAALAWQEEPHSMGNPLALQAWQQLAILSRKLQDVQVQDKDTVYHALAPSCVTRWQQSLHNYLNTLTSPQGRFYENKQRVCLRYSMRILRLLKISYKPR